MKKLLSAVLAIFALMACDKNNEPEESMEVRVIKSISYEYSNKPSQNFSVNFSYDEKGRITGYSNMIDLTAVIAYSDDEKQATLSVDKLTYLLSFNDDGRVNNMLLGENVRQEWTYNNRYIVESNVYYSEWDFTGPIGPDGDPQKVTYTIIDHSKATWKNGNMIAVKSKTYKEESDKDYDEFDSFEYGKLLNKYNIDLNTLLIYMLFERVAVGWANIMLFDCYNASKSLITSGV